LFDWLIGNQPINQSNNCC